MFKRLFGRNKPAPPPLELPASLTQPKWQEPQHRYLDFFNLHLHGLSLVQACTQLTEKYLTPAPSSPVMLVNPQGEWVTAYCSPKFVATIGFNRQSSEIARQQNIWLIGYRVYAGEGFDVHYFDGADHVAGLAFGQDELEREPASAETFASIGDVSSVVPRSEAQHPLDFHFALLAACGITGADLTWAEALQKYETGELPEARLLPGGTSA